MGERFLTWYRKIDKNVKLAFAATFVLGLFVHIYKFTNMLPGHDSVYNYYESIKPIITGRWFLKIACSFSSYFNLPWINGLLALIYIAITVAIVIDIFKIKNPILAILVGGILVSYQGMPETFLYDFLTDSYMLSMLLATIAVRLSLFDEEGVFRKIVASVFLCLSCAIYQSFVSFAMVLTLCYFANELLENRRSVKECWIWIRNQIFIYGGGLAAYYAIWKILITVQNVTVTSYQGIDSAGLSLPVILSGFARTLRAFGELLFERGLVSQGINAAVVLNAIFLVATMYILFVGIKKSQIYKRGIQFVFFVLCIFLMPIATCIWTFTSATVMYRPMMMYGVCAIIIWIAILYERWSSQHIKDLVAILLIAIIFNSSLQANISYSYLERCYETSYAMGAEMMARIHMLDEEADSIVVVGELVQEAVLTKDPLGQKIPLLIRLIEKHFLFDHAHTVLFLDHTFQNELTAVEKEEISQWETKKEVQEMGCWPEKDSVKVIDKTVVIKLSE